MESKITLYPHQEKALDKLRNGSILCGEVGTGKTLTGLSFYISNFRNTPLYVITTAKKRDSNDWQEEAALLGIEELVVDSWNNIEKYSTVTDAFFLFDEQRVVGYGKWTKNFIKITRNNNKWLLLTGTPGDSWSDYIPVFIANGFFRNKTHFDDIHVEYDRFSKFPKIKKYHNVGSLQNMRNHILVPMPMERHTVRHRLYKETTFNKELYAHTLKNKWNPYLDEPAKSPSELTQCLRRIVATSDGRIHEAVWQLNHLDKVIVFYNYNYELDILKSICEFIHKDYSQWNGHVHEELLEGDDWVYLVQYTAGAEGWNCTETNNVLFYSPNYSYKITEQAEGRIDRMNTKFVDLDYIYLTSKSAIDKAVFKAIETKKSFNESNFMRRRMLDVREQISE